MNLWNKLRSVVEGLVDRWRSHVQKEIDTLVSNRAGVMNDALEMEIEQRILYSTFERWGYGACASGLFCGIDGAHGTIGGLRYLGRTR